MWGSSTSIGRVLPSTIRVIWAIWVVLPRGGVSSSTIAQMWIEEMAGRHRAWSPRVAPQARPRAQCGNGRAMGINPGYASPPPALYQPALFHRRPDEGREQRVRRKRSRFQLGMELDADEPGMILVLDHLRQE